MQILAACLTILSACGSNHIKSPTTATSGMTTNSDSQTTNSDSQVYSADTKKRLKQIEDEYRVVLIGHTFQVAGGIVTEQRKKDVTNALHDVLGNDFTNYTIKFLAL